MWIIGLHNCQVECMTIYGHAMYMYRCMLIVCTVTACGCRRDHVTLM